MTITNRFIPGLVAATTLFLACSSGSSGGGDKDSGSSSTPPHTDASAHDTGSTARQDASATDARAVAATWTFQGGETILSLHAGTTPSSVTIPAGGDVSATVGLTFAKPTASGALTLSTAESGCCGSTGSDVFPPTLPADDAEDLSMSATPGSVGDPTLYISFYNAAPTAISFATTPAVTIVPTDGSDFSEYIQAMDECQLDLYLLDASGKGTWTAIPASAVMLDGESTTVSIPSGALPDGGALEIAPGQLVGGITCD